MESKVGTASWGNPTPVFLPSTGSVLQFYLWIYDIMFYPFEFYPLMLFCILLENFYVQLITGEYRYDAI